MYTIELQAAEDYTEHTITKGTYNQEETFQNRHTLKNYDGSIKALANMTFCQRHY